MRLAFSTIVARVLGSVLVGGLVYALAHAGVLALLGHGPARHPVLAVALPALVGGVAGVLLMRRQLRRPEYAGGWNVGGWFGRRRGWDDRYDDPGLGQVVVADAVGDIIEVVVDAALD